MLHFVGDISIPGYYDGSVLEDLQEMKEPYTRKIT